MKYIIVGGVAGGASVAARLRRNDENAEIILVERGEYISYANCGLPYYIGGTISDRENLFVQTVEEFSTRFNIEIRTRSEVESIDPEKKSVEIFNLETNNRYFESYDKLILSPGAEPIKPRIEGIGHPSIFTLRNIPDTDRIKRFVNVNKVNHAVVVGGGFIGLEMAENLHHLGIEVTVVEMADQVMASLDYSMAAIVHSEMRAKGVNLHLKNGVNKFADRDGKVEITLTDGEQLVADLVIWSIGVRPETKLAREANLELGERGGIKVNDYLQTSNPDIYALGDAIEVRHRVLDQYLVIPLAGPANKQGRIVANNIVYGNSHKYKGTMGTGIAKVFDLTVASTGANEKMLSAAGIDYLASFTHSSSHAGYYPNALPLSIKILFSPKDGKLLGAQVVGYEGVDKRIDLFAQTVGFNGTIYDLMEIEHAYAPPYSSAKDPVNMAGFVAEGILKERIKIIHWRELEKIKGDDDVVLIDVRVEEEHIMSAIEGALNIPLDTLRERVDEIPKGKKIIIYCTMGLRGYLAYRILVQRGFEDVYNLSGGYKTYSIATNIATTEQFFAGQMGSDDLLVEIDKESVISIDATGLQCPGPVMRLKEGYNQLSNGEQLEIRTTDSSFERDIASWCNVTGAKLISLENRKGIITAKVQKVDSSPACVTLPNSPINTGKTIVIFSDDLDKALASFIIANGAAAMGRKVTLFFTFWGLNVIKKREANNRKSKSTTEKMFDWMLPKGPDNLKLSKMDMFGVGRSMMKGIMKNKNIETLDSLIAQAQENGVEFIACTMSMDVMGVKPEDLIDGIDYAGVATYLERTDESNMSLFI